MSFWEVSQVAYLEFKDFTSKHLSIGKYWKYIDSLVIVIREDLHKRQFDLKDEPDNETGKSVGYQLQ